MTAEVQLGVDLPEGPSACPPPSARSAEKLAPVPTEQLLGTGQKQGAGVGHSCFSSAPGLPLRCLLRIFYLTSSSPVTNDLIRSKEILN